MDSKHQNIARQCLEGAESGTMTFPEIVGTLTAGAFDGYPHSIVSGTYKRLKLLVFS